MANDLKQRAYEEERSENFGRAIELYRSVIDDREAEGLTHQDASMFVRIADLHLRRDEEEEAIEAFQRAGELYAREGLQPQAIAIYRRILRIAPRHTEALWNLAWLHAEMGVMAEARQYVADYLETVDMERDWVEAKDFLRRLLDLSDDTAIGLRLAELYEEAGQHQDALDVLDRLDVDVGATSGLDADEVRRRIEAVREDVEPEEGAAAGTPEAGAGPGGGAEELGDAGPGVEDASPDVGAGEEPEEPGVGEGTFPADEWEDEEDEVGRPAASGGGWDGETDEHSDFDIEVGDDEEGALDDAFPFPDDGADDVRGPGPEEEDAETAGEGDFGAGASASDDFENGDLDGESFGDGDFPPGAFDEESPAEGAVERPEAEFGAGEESIDEPGARDEEEADEDEERPAAGFDQPSPWQSEDDAEDEAEVDAPETQEEQSEEQEREDPMTSRTEDPYGGPAVETGDEPEPSADHEQADGFGGARATETGSRRAESRDADYEEEYGERAELRRGLDVLDELIELDPDRLEHYRRRIGYAERLDDEEALAESHVQLADRLRSRGSSRAARLVYERMREQDAGREAAREGIEELDRAARETLGLAEPFPDAELSRPEAPGEERSELGRRVWPELDRSLEQVQWLHGAAERLRESGDGPPAEAYELVGRYFLAKDDADGAIDALSLALDRSDLDDGELADVLFVLGLSHYRIDDRGSARKYFERVADQDEDFAAVSEWLLSES